MRMSVQNHVAVTLVAAALALPLAARAQSNTPAETPAPSTQKADTNADASAAPASRAETVEQRIADMRETLHITPAQQSEWDRFAQVMRDNAKAMDATVKASASKAATMNALDNMHTYERITEQHAQGVRKLTTAFGTLYNSLSSEQKSAADEMFRTAAMERQAKRGGG